MWLTTLIKNGLVSVARCSSILTRFPGWLDERDSTVVSLHVDVLIGMQWDSAVRAEGFDVSLPSRVLIPPHQLMSLD